MKRVLSFLCAVAMVLTMCTFYMGEALSVVAEEEQIPAENIVSITAYEQLIAEMAKEENKGKTLRLEADLYASEWTFSAAKDGKITATKADATATISVANDATFGKIAEEGVTIANSSYANVLVDGVNIDGNGKTIYGFVALGDVAFAHVSFIDTVGKDSTVKGLKFAASAIVVSGTTNAAPVADEVYGKVIDCETAADVTVALTFNGAGEVFVSGIASGLYSNGVEPANPSELTLQEVYQGIVDGSWYETSVALVDGCVNKAALFVYTASTAKDLDVGGIFGGVMYSSAIVRNCANYGDITVVGKANGVGGIGGILRIGRKDAFPVGYGRDISIYNCANYGAIDTAVVTGNTTHRAGGIIGFSDADLADGGQLNIFACYNAGTLTTKGNEFGIVGSQQRGFADVTLADGFRYESRLNGGTALNFINYNKVDKTTSWVADRDDKVEYTYNGKALATPSTMSPDMIGGSGNFSLSRIFAAPGNVSGTSYFDSTNVATILNNASKYLEGAKPWTEDESGVPQINFAGTASTGTVSIANKTDLENFKLMHDYCENLGSEIEICAKLTADIDLNPGFTFGYDAEKEAGVVTDKDGVTYYLGYGENSLSAADAGKFYNAEGAEVDAPEGLYSWAMFSSMLSTVSTTTAMSDKVTLRLDGNGKTISGLYINDSTSRSAGFASTVSGVNFSNLTLDGLIVHTFVAFQDGTGAFIGKANNDCTVVDCVNNVDVLKDGCGINTPLPIDPENPPNTSIGGIVGYMGLSGNSAWIFERMPNRICKVIGTVNNGTVAISTTNKVRIGGIVGDMTQGEVSYCTNTGLVRAANPELIAGIVTSTPNLNATANWTVPAYIAAGAQYTTSGGGSKIASGVSYVADVTPGTTKVTPPYQTTIRVIGNSNSGTISYDTVRNSSYNPSAILTGVTSGMSDGAWGIWGNEDKVGPIAVLPSEFTYKDNVGQGGLRVAGANDYGNHGLFWKDGGPDLHWRDSGRYANTGNIWIQLKDNDTAASFAATLTNALLSMKNVRGDGYMMWIDYDYSNKGIPHAIKVSEAAANGITLASGENGLEIGVSTADALRLINDTVNTVTTKTVTVDGVTYNGLFDAHNKATVAGAAAGNTAAALDSYVKNVVTAYLNAGKNGVTADLTSLTGVTVKLLDNIDLGGKTWLPLGNARLDNGDTSGNEFVPQYGFAGTFDGNGKTVSNFTFPRMSYVGFFGAILGGSVKNLTFSNVNIHANNYIGIAACYADATFDNVVIDETCSITADYACAAALAYKQNGDVKNCVNYADITANKNSGRNVAGLISIKTNGKLENCINYGDITITKEKEGSNIGGLVGSLSNSSDEFVVGNKNFGNVTAPMSTVVGGIIGLYSAVDGKNGTIKNCVNEGAITARTYVAGIVARKDNWSNNTISNCVNNGTIIGDSYVGGIGAFIRMATIDSCINNGPVTGAYSVAGIHAHAYTLTVLKCENTENATITCLNTGDVTAPVAGIVATINAGSIVIKQNVNRGDIIGAKVAAGIFGQVSNTNNAANIIEGNVNYGDISGYALTAGIVSVLGTGNGDDNVVLVKGNVNYGAIDNENKTEEEAYASGGIVAREYSGGSKTVCYNVNFGSIGFAWAKAGIVGAARCNTSKLTTDLYGNIDASASRAYSAGFRYGWNANNYSVNQGANCTLVDLYTTGNAVTPSVFASGHIAYIINNLEYTAGNFLAGHEDYLFGANGHEPAFKPLTDAMNSLTESAWVEPAGLEKDYMVQRIGIDAYPLPRLAAELIYENGAADCVVPAGTVATVVPDAPETSGNEHFLGYIDSAKTIYRPGTTLTKETFLYPLTVEFYTVFGAGVRTTSPTGIRYKTVVNADDIAIMGDTFSKNFGTVIIPTYFAEGMLENTAKYGKVDVALIKDNNIQHVDIENDGWASAEFGALDLEGYNTYMGSLVEIKEQNYDLNFTGLSYVQVQYYGESKLTYFTADWQEEAGTFVDGANYSEAANSRSVQQVAYRALNDSNFKPSAAVRETLEMYRGTYSE